MKKFVSLIAISFFSFQVIGQTINLETYATGFSSPIDILNADDERLFIVEKSGSVKIIDGQGNTMPQPFIDVDQFVINASSQSERGLLGMAFHPNYAENGFFYLNYIDNNGNTRIDRFGTTNDANVANLESRELIISIDQPASNHNGGCIKFGPDGYLYIGMGDGGSGNDPWNNSQNNNTRLGKMLRIDVDNGLPYTIPADNPFINDTDFLDEIWAIGLRNPWKFSFDSETGDLWIADVGQDEKEEIDFQSATSTGGENYGWRCYEGTYFTDNDPQADCPEDVIEPVFEMQHQGGTGVCSVTGGFVYRGSQYPDLFGKYVFADFCSGEFFVVTKDGDSFSGEIVAQFNNDVAAFGVDQDKELYMASLSNGVIYRVKGETVGTNSIIPSINNISIEPNPSNGISTLSIHTDESIDIDLSLNSFLGRSIFTESHTINGQYRKTIDLSNLPAGTYILNVNAKTGLITKKIIKI